MLPISIFLAKFLKQRPGAKPNRYFGLIRVAGYGMVAMTGVGLLAMHSAKASWNEASFQVGRELMPMADMLKETHKIRVNGEFLSVSSSMSDASPTVAIERFEANCRENAMDSMKELMADPRMPIGSRSSPGTFAKSISPTGNDGYLVCASKSSQSKGTLMDSLNAFRKSGDLGAIGKFRYIYVKRTPEGGSHVIAVWTDDVFNLNHVIPRDNGDAPGSDAPDAPRPPDARRVMTASFEGTGYSVRTYDAKGTREEILHYYDLEMSKRGYNFVTTKESMALNLARGYLKEGFLWGVSVKDGVKGGTVVELVEIGNEAKTLPAPAAPSNP